MDGALVEGGQGGLDLAEPLVHLVGQFVSVLVLHLQPFEFGIERVDRAALLLGQVDRRARQRPQAGRHAIGQVHRRLDPLPALARDLVGEGRQLLRRKPVEQCGVLQPAPSSDSKRSRSTTPPAAS